MRGGADFELLVELLLEEGDATGRPPAEEGVAVRVGVLDGRLEDLPADDELVDLLEEEEEELRTGCAPRLEEDRGDAERVVDELRVVEELDLRLEELELEPPRADDPLRLLLPLALDDRELEADPRVAVDDRVEGFTSELRCRTAPVSTEVRKPISSAEVLPSAAGDSTIRSIDREINTESTRPSPSRFNPKTTAPSNYSI